MKPAQFKYFDPRTTAEAVELLRAHGSEAKLLAGGQSLMPLLNMRLARPSAVVDLNRVAELDYVRPKNGGVAIGAMTRLRALEHDPLLAERFPVLHALAGWIAHPQIRNRGTIGGSIAHADPAAELPAAALALEARLTAVGPKGSRTLSPDQLFVGYLATSLATDEVLTEVYVPELPAGAGWSIQEIARRKGDFALAGVITVLTFEKPNLTSASIAYFGMGARPVRIPEVERMLVGQAPSDDRLEAAGRQASAAVQPDDDIHATAEYRRAMAGVLTVRSVREALNRVKGGLA